MLEILLAARGHRVPTDRLADLLWGQSPPEDAAGSIQAFVSVLRRHLSPDRELARKLVVTEAEAYRFATDTIEFDLDEFDELHDRSAREPTHVARRSLEQALSLVRGQVLEASPTPFGRKSSAAPTRGACSGHTSTRPTRPWPSSTTQPRSRTRRRRPRSIVSASERGAPGCSPSTPSDVSTKRSRRTAASAGCSTSELGLEPTGETRALEAAILRQEDVRPLLPRAILRPPEDGGGASVRLLGRTSELAVLERAVRQALDGSFALLQIEGERGLGKTRLLDELVQARWSACVSGGQAVRNWSSTFPTCRSPPRCAKRFTVRSTASVLPALRRILPELALADPPRFAEVDVLETLVALVADHAPLVLLIDDIQWADASTIAALSYLQAVAPAWLPRRHGGRRHRARAPRSPLCALTTRVRLAPLAPPSSRRSGYPTFTSQPVEIPAS